MLCSSGDEILHKGVPIRPSSPILVEGQIGGNAIRVLLCGVIPTKETGEGGKDFSIGVFIVGFGVGVGRLVVIIALHALVIATVVVIMTTTAVSVAKISQASSLTLCFYLGEVHLEV